MKFRSIVAGVALMASLAACSSSDDSPEVRVEDEKTTTTSEPTTTTTEAPKPSEAARGYFEAFATGDVVKMEKMSTLAVKDSPAWLYAIHQTNLTRMLESGTEQDLTLKDDRYELCASDGTEEACVIYGDFTADRSGKLTGFTVDGTPLKELIAAGGPEVVSGGVAVKVSTVYQSVSGRFFVIFDIRNTTGEPLPTGTTLYLTPEGRQTESEGSGLFNDIAPGATAQDFAAFPSAKRGGTLLFQTFTDDFANEVEVRVPVP